MKAVYSITEKPIDLSAWQGDGQDPSCGANVIFVGTVRNPNGGKAIIRLEYESYGPMAEKVFAEIGAEVEKKPGIKSCSIVHRIGKLKPGEISVVVVVTAEHRTEAFAACENVVTELKKRAPIWKKEIYQDGTSEWLAGHARL
jgi:molybdopterin synthase catalytic subunit